MREGSIFSAVFHLALIGLMVFGLPSLFEPPPEPEPISTVEVVTMSEKATAPTPPKPPVPKPPEPKPPEEVKPPPPAPPPSPQAQPKPPEPAPPKPPEPQKEAEAIKPAPKKEEPKPEPPKPTPRRQEPKREPPKKPQPDPFDTVLKNLDQNRPAPPSPQRQPPRQQAALPQPVQSAPNLSDQLSRSEMDAVKDLVRQCWNFPAGAKDAEQLLVDVWVSMNPDGTVREARVVDAGRMSRDPYFRSAAESALRAVLNPRCSPLPLPREKYNTWKTFIFGFDPRDL